MTPLKITVADHPPWLKDAAVGAGAEVVEPESAEAVIWGLQHNPETLRLLLDRNPRITWVQLASAGVDEYTPLFSDGRVWTSAKGAFAGPVAEHALALVLAGLRELPQRARARHWGDKGGRTLADAAITIIGAGGVARALVELMAPFHPVITVVGMPAEEIPGAHRLLDPHQLDRALQGAEVVVLAAALTADTRGMIGREQLRLMGPGCWLVNVARGLLVRTDDLVEALQQGMLGGAALDVTDPEPLPDGHPLWRCQNCLITPHTANPPQLERKLLSLRIQENIRRRSQGIDLEGVIDPVLGY